MGRKVLDDTMDPRSKKLRELEAYVQRLEAENRRLRAELNKGTAPPRDSPVDEASANYALQS